MLDVAQGWLARSARALAGVALATALVFSASVARAQGGVGRKENQ